MTVRVPKDSLRDQLALAAGAKINLGFGLELLTIALEWERAEHAAEIARVEVEIAAVLSARDRQHLAALADKGRLLADDRKRAVAAEAENGRTLAWYAFGIALVVGLIVGSVWT